MNYQPINHPAKSILSPEEQLVLAVYIRARQDLAGKHAKWRRDAEMFFRLDGFDPEKIRRAWTREFRKD